MTYQWTETSDDVDWDELSELYQLAGMGTKPPDLLATVFGNSRYAFFVRLGKELIGVGRALTDELDCAYLCDVAVRPDHQGQGLGREIIDRLVQRSQDHKKIILFANPGTERFYHKAGFARMRTAMAIFRNQSAAVKAGLLEENPSGTTEASSFGTASQLRSDAADIQHGVKPEVTQARMHVAAQWFLRIALAAGFLSAVADRFGLWGAPGTSGVAWGDWPSFVAYVAELNWFAPSALIPALAWAATLAEIVIALGLLIGWRLRWFALASGLLLMSFALTMTLALDIKAPLDYSVFAAAAGSFLLAAACANRHAT